jgi:putative GTP pyrophosphokinase
MIRIGPTEEQILKNLATTISSKLDAAGIFNRVFSRIKSKASIEKKLHEKQEEYSVKGKKMQDVFGIRVTVYFSDDEKIATDLVKSIFIEIPGAHSIDPLTKDQFGPIRNNLVFKIDERLAGTSGLFDHPFIDSSFEVQFRTVFSEGWHEVEHDLRYKCKKDWEKEDLLSRQLNGQLAALETSDWAMLKIFDELAYKKYKEKDWNSFFRNILRIRFEDFTFSQPVLDVFNNTTVGKELLKLERTDLISGLIAVRSNIPLKMDNVLLIINRAALQNTQIMGLETAVMKGLLEESFSKPLMVSGSS